MKQGLSLRISQHLALTPQLQQSIRLLQLSTLEMAQEVEQMLDENPFLERAEEASDREEFGVMHAREHASPQQQGRRRDARDGFGADETDGLGRQESRARKREYPRPGGNRRMRVRGHRGTSDDGGPAGRAPR